MNGVGLGGHEKLLCCHDCGIPYRDLGVDLVLPDQQWKKLFPENYGVLCANCICKRAEKLKGTAILAWINNVDYSTEYNGEPLNINKIV